MRLIYKIARYAPDQPERTDTFQIDIDPERTILDGVEQIWAEQDRSLTFRHACHHASCGSCGLVANGTEKLPCIVQLKDVVKDGDTLSIEPLHNFPVVADLVVDMSAFFARMQLVNMPIVGPADPLKAAPQDDISDYYAFQNCIECGICLSACPVVATDEKYLGPAALAAAQRLISTSPDGLQALSEEAKNAIDSDEGLWRCHAAFECTAACPSNVDPAGKIMDLRRRKTVARLRGALGLTK